VDVVFCSMVVRSYSSLIPDFLHPRSSGVSFSVTHRDGRIRALTS
jgi:hypothetical protein